MAYKIEGTAYEAANLQTAVNFRMQVDQIILARFKRYGADLYKQWYDEAVQEVMKSGMFTIEEVSDK